MGELSPVFGSCRPLPVPSSKIAHSRPSGVALVPHSQNRVLRILTGNRWLELPLRQTKLRESKPPIPEADLDVPCFPPASFMALFGTS